MSPVDKLSGSSQPTSRAQPQPREAQPNEGRAQRSGQALRSRSPGETLDELDARLQRLELHPEERYSYALPMPIGPRTRPRSPTILDLSDPFAGDHVMQPLSPHAQVPYSWQRSPRLVGVDPHGSRSADERDRLLLRQMYGGSPRQVTRLELAAPAQRVQPPAATFSTSQPSLVSMTRPQPHSPPDVPELNLGLKDARQAGRPRTAPQAQPPPPTRRSTSKPR